MDPSTQAAHEHLHHEHPHPHPHPHPPYAVPPPDEPPPSYDEATHSATAPLLVGPSYPSYGIYGAYDHTEESSEASSFIERTDRSLPEWVGQALVVTVFVGIIYGFWKLVNDPDLDGGFP